MRSEPSPTVVSLSGGVPRRQNVEDQPVNRMAASGEREALYEAVFGEVSKIIDAAGDSAARPVNAAMTAACWLIVHRVVGFEQSGEERAEYGAALIERPAADLTRRSGRGFSPQNVQHMRLFYLSRPPGRIRQTASGEFHSASAGLLMGDLLAAFPPPWSAYVRGTSVRNEHARAFYEAGALRGGWPVRRLDRQISSRFYERSALSKNKAAVLKRGQRPRPDDLLLPEEEIKDPFVLEFLDLKDEYSKSDLEESLVRHPETFLMELGGDFCFMGRQRRLRTGSQWRRVDLLFFHRGLRCPVATGPKTGAFTHAGAGQMRLYLNYALQRWVREGENPPVRLILCSEKDDALA